MRVEALLGEELVRGLQKGVVEQLERKAVLRALGQAVVDLSHDLYPSV